MRAKPIISTPVMKLRKKRVFYSGRRVLVCAYTPGKIFRIAEARWPRGIRLHAYSKRARGRRPLLLNFERYPRWKRPAGDDWWHCFAMPFERWLEKREAVFEDMRVDDVVTLWVELEVVKK